MACLQVASLISGKGGIVHVHVGSGDAKLALLFDVVSNTEIPIAQFHLTHIASRSAELQQEARVRLRMRRGGGATWPPACSRPCQSPP